MTPSFAIPLPAADAIIARTKGLGTCPTMDLTVLADSGGLTIIRALPRGPQARTTWDSLSVVFASYTSCTPDSYRFEFGQTIVRSGHPALFVYDLTHRWYVDDSHYDRVCAAIRGQMAALGTARLTTVGDSMGGYAALAYAQDLPIDYALAITTRSGIGPGAVPDIRQQPQLAPPYARLRVPDLRRALARLPAGMMIHGTRGPDRVHLPRLRARGAVDHWIVPGRGHGIAAWMKQNGILYPVVRAALDADAAEANRLVAGRGAVRRDSLNARARLAAMSLYDRVSRRPGSDHHKTAPSGVVSLH